MAKFFVGQRVRIIGCEMAAGKCHVGKEGVIVTRCPVYDDSWDVDSARKVPDGRLISWHEDNLQPILPSGAAPSEYSFAELLDECRRIVHFESGRVEV